MVAERVPITAVMRPATAFEIVSVDCAGPIVPTSSRGYSYLLIIVDQCTRWIECLPLKKLTAIETCTALGKFFYSIGTIPRVVVSDNGTNFVASLTKEFYSFFGIELRNFTPLHPAGNGIAETAVGTVNKSLKHITASEDGKNWDLYLPKIL